MKACPSTMQGIPTSTFFPIKRRRAKGYIYFFQIPIDTVNRFSGFPYAGNAFLLLHAYSQILATIHQLPGTNFLLPMWPWFLPQFSSQFFSTQPPSTGIFLPPAFLTWSSSPSSISFVPIYIHSLTHNPIRTPPSLLTHYATSFLPPSSPISHLHHPSSASSSSTCTPWSKVSGRTGDNGEKRGVWEAMGGRG